MREIKFRAWDKKNQKWLPDWKIAINSEGKLLCAYSDKTFGEWKIKYVLMQSLDKKDKNGKEFYDSDLIWILLADGEKPPFPSRISWFNTKWIIEHPNGDISNFDILRPIDYEIIGNIYENPELIKT